MDTYEPTQAYFSTQDPAVLPTSPLEIFADETPAVHGEPWSDVPNGWNGMTLDGGTYSLPTHPDVDTDNYPEF